jgi:hypothetical protein
MVGMHYDKRHLKDVIRRQKEEIDRTHNQIRDSGTLIDHLRGVKNTHEERIHELTTKRDAELAKNKQVRTLITIIFYI